MTSPLITDINIGDIYVSKKVDLIPRLIGGTISDKPYQFLGYLGLRAFMPNNKINWTRQEAINNLNENDFYFAGNINDKVNKSLDLATDQMQNKWKNQVEAKAEKIKPNFKAHKLDIPDGYKLLGDKDIIPKNAKYKFKNYKAWLVVLCSAGKTVEWGKERFGNDIQYIAPMND